VKSKEYGLGELNRLAPKLHLLVTTFTKRVWLGVNQKKLFLWHASTTNDLDILKELLWIMKNF